MDIIYEGIRFGESARWHDRRVWFADWAAGEVISLDEQGTPKIEAQIPSFPLCFDFLPDGRLLLASSADRKLLRREADGMLTEYADLGSISHKPWNEVVVEVRGSAYVNSIGFDFPEGEFEPGFIVRATSDGTVAKVAQDLAFPNGMAITPDNSTLVVAESYAQRLTGYSIGDDGTLTDRRVWAETPDDHPDGICLDTEGAVWYADVGTSRCVRVREGGEVLESVEFGRGAFSCALSRDDESKLYAVGQDFGGNPFEGPAGGVLAVFPAPAPGAVPA